MPLINKPKRKREEVIIGDMTVSGESNIAIRLEHGRPTSMRVRFLDEQTAPLPCNPGTVDVVEADIVVSNGKVDLVIAWIVSSSRKVGWEVKYS